VLRCSSGSAQPPATSVKAIERMTGTGFICLF
jgi:hypothetical protein